MGRRVASGTLCSADDVLDTLLEFADRVIGGTAYLLIGHSAGAYYAQAMAARRPAQVAGLALVCPLLPGLRDVPEHRVVAGSGVIGDAVFRSYFVIQTPRCSNGTNVTWPQPPRSSTRRHSGGSANDGSSPPMTRRLTRVRPSSWRGGRGRPSGGAPA